MLLAIEKYRGLMPNSGLEELQQNGKGKLTPWEEGLIALMVDLGECRYIEFGLCSQGCWCKL